MNTSNNLNDAGEDLSLSVNETLEQRGNRYGKYSEVARLSKDLREMFFKHHKMFNSKSLSDAQIESLFMIFNKLSRIANGDPDYVDNWRDISGYSELIVKELSNG